MGPVSVAADERTPGSSPELTERISMTDRGCDGWRFRCRGGGRCRRSVSWSGTVAVRREEERLLAECSGGRCLHVGGGPASVGAKEGTVEESRRARARAGMERYDAGKKKRGWGYVASARFEFLLYKILHLLFFLTTGGSSAATMASSKTFLSCGEMTGGMVEGGKGVNRQKGGAVIRRTRREG